MTFYAFGELIMQDNTLSEEFDAYSVAVIFLNRYEEEAAKLEGLLTNIESEMAGHGENAGEVATEIVLADLDVIEENIEIHTKFIEGFESKTTPSQRAELFKHAVESNAEVDAIMTNKGNYKPKYRAFEI